MASEACLGHHHTKAPHSAACTGSGEVIGKMQTGQIINIAAQQVRANPIPSRQQEDRMLHVQARVIEGVPVVLQALVAGGSTCLWTMFELADGDGLDLRPTFQDLIQDAGSGFASMGPRL